MDTKTRKSTSRPDQNFWQAAFLSSVWPILLAHDGNKLTPTGAAHLCGEFADFAVEEQRRRFK